VEEAARQTGVEDEFCLLECNAVQLVKSQHVAFVFSSMKQVASRASFLDPEPGGHIQNIS
jgi:hypothetical protein